MGVLFENSMGMRMQMSSVGNWNGYYTGKETSGKQRRIPVDL